MSEIPREQELGQQPEQQEPEKTVVLTLPEDPIQVKRLDKKLEEYLQEHENYIKITNDPHKSTREKEAFIDLSWESYYKTIMLRTLLESKKVDSNVLREESQQTDHDFRQDIFNNAVKNVEALIKNNGPENLTEGSVLQEGVVSPELGIPKREQEVTPAPVEKAKEAENKEINPFLEQEKETIGNLAKKSAKGIEISSKSKKDIDGFLSVNREELYREFNLNWFEDNKDQIKEKGLPTENVSDDWKISTVSDFLKEEELATEIRKGKHPELGAELDKIGILKTDMARNQIPIETPFLLLNYLQASIAREKERIIALKTKASTGNELAGIQAASKEGQLRELYEARKEIVEKITPENLSEFAKNKVNAWMPAREKEIEGAFNAKKREIEDKKNDEVIDSEWKKFDMLQPKQKRAFYKKLSINDGQIIGDKNDFKGVLVGCAGKNGIKGLAFYGMIEKGYKPYEELKTKGFFKSKKIMLSGSPSGLSAEGYQKTIKKSEEDYLLKIQRAGDEEKIELGKKWDKWHEEQVNEAIEARIKELADSPENAKDGIEAAYGRRREIIVAEYISQHMPKEKTPEEKKKIDQEFGEDKKTIKAEKAKAIPDVLFKLSSNAIADENGGRSGGLEKLSGEIKEDAGILSDYFRKEIGVTEVNPIKLRNIITKEKNGPGLYKKAWGEDRGLFDWFIAILTDRPWKAKIKK